MSRDSFVEWQKRQHAAQTDFEDLAWHQSVEMAELRSTVDRLRAEVERLLEVGVLLANLVRQTAHDSTVTWSDDPGCWHCDDCLSVNVNRDEWGHAKDCEAMKALCMWRKATKHRESKR